MLLSEATSDSICYMVRVDKATEDKLVEMQNNIRLRPDSRKRPPARIYFIATSNLNM